MPTPTVGDSKSARNSTAIRHKTPPTGVHAGDTLTDAVTLLSTPRVTSERTSRTAAVRFDSRSGPSLEQATEIAKGELPREFANWEELPTSWQPGDLLLPTPQTGYAGTTEEAWRERRPAGNGGSRGAVGDLSLAVQAQQWGKYTTAITRWEWLTRPAPEPTEPNTNGRPRLVPRFVEWMMGWADGWVTGVPGLQRTAQLKLIGNGVVTAQAEYALSLLMKENP